jgi:hypothetical protein
MKSFLKYTLAIIFLLSVGIAHSLQAQCQLCYLTKDAAIKAVEYLKMKKEAVLFAGCENGDIARHIQFTKINYRKVIDPLRKEERFEIYAEGKVVGTFDIINQKPDNYVKTEMQFNDVIDIAYVHISAGGYRNSDGKDVWDATCLGIYLGFECDPCIDPFDYPMANLDN